MPSGSAITSAMSVMTIVEISAGISDTLSDV